MGIAERSNGHYMHTVGFMDSAMDPEMHGFGRTHCVKSVERLMKPHGTYTMGGEIPHYLLTFPGNPWEAGKQAELGVDSPYKSGVLCVLSTPSGQGSDILHSAAAEMIGLREAPDVVRKPRFNAILCDLASALADDPKAACLSE